MKKNKHATNNHRGTLVKDARALKTAAAGVVGKKIGEARNRHTAALETTRKIAGNIRNKTVAGAKAADKAVRQHPYKALAIGVGTGLLAGFLAGRRSSRKTD